MRALFIFIIIMSIVTAAIFGYKYVSKNDVKITGKLFVAGLIALLFTAIITILEG